MHDIRERSLAGSDERDGDDHVHRPAQGGVRGRSERGQSYETSDDCSVFDEAAEPTQAEEVVLSLLASRSDTRAGRSAELVLVLRGVVGEVRSTREHNADTRGALTDTISV